MNTALLMAGGLGLRLRPATLDRPKPMIEVRGKPILEHTIERLVVNGFTDIYISLGYMGDVIEQHFGDGSAWGVNIGYLREDKPTGTAGALCLLPDIMWPLLVMNGDLIVDMDFAALVAFHVKHAAPATIVVRDHVVSVPYGVVDGTGRWMMGIREKPAHVVKINAGIYVLNKAAASMVDERMDMPDLFRRVIDVGGLPTMYSFMGHWADIGNEGDLNHVQRMAT